MNRSTTEKTGEAGPDCRQAFEEIELLWSEGRLDEIQRPRGMPSDTLARHLGECAACRAEVRALGNLDRVLSDGFHRLERTIPPPGEDRIARMLRSVTVHPHVPLLRRIRRSLKTILWMAFFVFSLLASCALGALAYHVLFRK